MKTSSVFLCFLSLSFSFLIYGQRSQSKAYVADLKEITDIMMYDVTSPVAAARYYAYSTLASYELLAYRDKQHSSFFDFFQRPIQNSFPEPMDLKNPVMAYRYALLFSASKLLPSGNKLQNRIGSLKSALSASEVCYIEAFVTSIVAYANQDGFHTPRENARKH